MALANIITNSETDFKYGFNVINNVSLIDKRLPTLYIGYMNMKSIGIKIESVFNRQINETTFWTFDKNEKRVEYDKDIVNFINFFLDYMEEKMVYESIDISTYSYSKLKNVYRILNSQIKKTVYISENSVFINFNHNVICIDLNSIDYIDIAREKVINKIKSFNNVHVYEDKKSIPNMVLRCVHTEALIPLIISNI